MRTNIDIDDALIDEVMRVANVKTKKEAVHLALQEFLKAKKKKDLFDLAGKIAFEDSYDHKALRYTRYDAD
jgi:Arc/MetJ family transcription regulator